MKLTGLTLIATVFLTFLYIYQQVDPVRISYEIKSNKKILVRLKEENSLLRYKLALLASPPNLEKEIENRNIQLCLGDRLKMVELIAATPACQMAGRRSPVRGVAPTWLTP